MWKTDIATKFYFRGKIIGGEKARDHAESGLVEKTELLEHPRNETATVTEQVVKLALQELHRKGLQPPKLQQQRISP